MNLTQLHNLLKASGYPVAYSHFKEPQSPPFICYLVNDSNNLMADNKVFKKIDNVSIELYTSKKDLAAESKIEQILDDNEIPYETYEVYIDSEKLFQKVYETSLI